MNMWMKLGLPLLLGAGAAAINWQVLRSELEPHYFVKVKQDMKAGELFKPGNLDVLVVKSTDGPGSLSGTAVRWENAAMLFDAPCVRELKTNDIVFLRDAPTRFKIVPLAKRERALQISLEDVRYEPALLMVGNQIGFVLDKNARLADVGPNTKALTARNFVLLGPFRILSVGKRVNPQAESDSADTSAGRVISVAVKIETAADGTEVMDDLANRLLAAASHQSSSRRTAIEAVVLYPSKE